MFVTRPLLALLALTACPPLAAQGLTQTEQKLHRLLEQCRAQPAALAQSLKQARAELAACQASQTDPNELNRQIEAAREAARRQGEAREREQSRALRRALDEAHERVGQLEASVKSMARQLEKKPAPAPELATLRDRLQTAERERDEARSALAALQAIKVPKAANYKDCPDCPEMVPIPAGRYQRGSTDGDADEKPVRWVNVPAFAMSKTETTVGQFRRFVRASGHKTTAEKEGSCYADDGKGNWGYQSGRHWDNPGFPQTDNHPVACVSWDDAKAYAKWLAQETGKPYRLPSEAEWEYAARGGTTTKWIWGDDANGGCRDANIADRTAKEKYGWTDAAQCPDGHVYTAPVGSFRANGFGLQDMIGQVWEWVEDCYQDSYNGAPTDGSARTGGSCERRVLRGGSWNYSPRLARAANRYGLTPAARVAHAPLSGSCRCGQDQLALGPFTPLPLGKNGGSPRSPRRMG